MIDNMRARQCELPGILACNTLADQETRFTAAGFTTVRVCLFDFYKPILFWKKNFLKSVINYHVNDFNKNVVFPIPGV